MNFDILGVGHIAHDTFCMVDEFPPLDTAKWLEGIEIQGGGAASQAIVAAKRLGCKTSISGVIGDDDSGMFLMNDFKYEGIDTECLVIRKNAITSRAIVIVEKNTGRRTILVHSGKSSDLKMNTCLEKKIRESKCLHLDTTNIDIALETAEYAKRHDTIVSLDACEIASNPQKTWELLKYVDILITNEYFPQELTQNENNYESLRALNRFSPKIILMTIGDKGCIHFNNGRIQKYPAFSVKAIDTTGAGDVFHGAFIAFHVIKGYSVAKSIKLSSATSAINCLTLGGRKGIPDIDTVNDFLKYNFFKEEI